MFIKRLFIGLLTLAAAVGVFWFYIQHQSTPEISIREFTDPNDMLLDVANQDGVSGTISDVIVGPVKTFKFEDRVFETGEIYRVWGFEDLLSKGSDVWQVVKPYMTVYESDMTCEITADFGEFRIEEINSNPYPKEGTFSGQVQVHVIPEPDSDMEEVFINLDEIVFQSSKSKFTCSGRIEVRSPSVRMSGQGVDFIYNDIERCIQYFRMVELDYLRVRTPKEGGLFSFDQPSSQPNDANQMAAESVASTDSNEPEPKKTGPIYTCVLQDNVLIRTPKQKVHALNHMTLSNILWPKTGFKTNNASNMDPNTTNNILAVDANDAVPGTDPNVVQVVDAVLPDVNLVPEEDMIDIILTCEQGILITPADSNWTPESEGLDAPEIAEIDVNLPSFYQQETDEGVFVAMDIGYDVQSKNARAQGPVEFTFYVSDVNEWDLEGQLIPINVTARKYGQFDANNNSIEFTDQCVCILQKQDPNHRIEEYHLEAPKIRIELKEDKESQTIAATRDLKHIEAVGGGVMLSMYTRVTESNVLPDEFTPAEGELLAGVEMTCEKFECDPNKGQEVFTATGPGTVVLNNAKAVLGRSADKKKKPYYAWLNGFETMQYYVSDNMINASTSDPNVLQFSYVPVTDDPNASNMEGQANHIQIYLVKTLDGQTEMGRLTASGNVSVTHGRNMFTGGVLSYNHETMELVIEPGDDGRACTFNGMTYPGIRYNLATSELETTLTDMSVLPLN